MNRYTRVGAVAVATALLSSPLAASAEKDKVHDKDHRDRPAYADVTSVAVRHKVNRVVARLRMPVVRKQRLAQARLKVQHKGSRATWVVTVTRNRRGEITHKGLTVRRPGKPLGIVFGCKLGTTAGVEVVYLSVPRDCVLGKRGVAPIRAKGQIVARAHGDRIKDSTPYTEWLGRD